VLIKKISPTLVLRSVQDENDIQRFGEFNRVFNNPWEGATCSCLLQHHPGANVEDFWMVEDKNSQEIVSTTCLIPWDCQYGEVKLRIAMLEMVLTHPEYRGKGLVRQQMDNFSQVVQQSQYDVSIIWGIPYYYRQFGYHYCLEGWGYDSLPVWQIPDRVIPVNPRTGEAGLPTLHLRQATLADIPYLETLYQETTLGLDFYVIRSQAYWEYLIQNAHFPIKILGNAQTGELLGYAVISIPPGDPPRILESGISSSPTALALLCLLKTQFPQEIQLGGYADSVLVKMGRSLGSNPQPAGQWLLRVSNLPTFLLKIAPVLEGRLKASGWENWDGDLIINLFREATRLRFNQGRLESVDGLGFVDSSMGADGGDLCIPPEAFTRLLFGFRGLDELRDAWPDIQVKPAARPLVEALFPHQSSWLHTPYFYMGQLP
jgi:predicted N-acetyltransferase YhbS